MRVLDQGEEHKLAKVGAEAGVQHDVGPRDEREAIVSDVATQWEFVSTEFSLVVCSYPMEYIG